ncbi:hypothetical protein CDD80_5806 [Ophiocordyceps camponoti-rufipedis]|uniref:Enterotoxin n=1 Tax=Ophiocordyceps camponoti-rufipedis TaxID=2004952 RepID=A0A2C5ZLJ3_9HYPO|nr:hypothetical protein CDD80_5806 [Ophiocordyceps camponoti-rufipedis]
MLHHWAAAASQAVVCLLLWPGLTSADAIDGVGLTYLGAIMDMNEAPAETLVKRDEGASSSSILFEEASSSSAPLPGTTALTPEADFQLQQMNNLPKPQRTDKGGLGATVRRIVVYIFGGCRDPLTYLSDEQDSWVHRASEMSTHELYPSGQTRAQAMPPEHQRIVANLTLYFGPFNPIRGLQSQLPHPVPTSYAADGTPFYEFWYEWPSSRDRNRPRGPRGPVQLVPKAAGCYNPPPGAMGSILHDCPRRGVKHPVQGWAPCLPGFPGAPGSSWAFRPPPEGMTSPSGVSRPGLRGGEVLAVLIMTYAPHFVEIILQLYDEMRASHHDKRDAPAEADQRKHVQLSTRVNMADQNLHLVLTRAFCSGMVDTIMESLASYDPPQNGLCITCDVTAQKADNIVLGNYTKQSFCNLFSTIYEHHGPHYSLTDSVTPSFFIHCDEPAAGDSCGGPPRGKGVGPEKTGSDEEAPYAFNDPEPKTGDVPYAYSMGNPVSPQRGPPNPKTNNVADKELHSSWQQQLAAARDGCSSFNELELEIRLDGRNRSATRDSIYVVFNGDVSHQVYITKHAWSGYHISKKIDIPKVFNKNNISFEDIYRVGLITKMEDDPRDGWGLKGIKLTASCASSKTKWEVDKYANVARWMDRKDSQKQYMPWVGTIQAKDWRKKIFESCSRFDRLQLSIVRAPSGDGAQDNVYIGFGEEGKQPIHTQVDKPGFQAWQDISIFQIWNTKEVGIDQIRCIQIKQLHVGDVENRDWVVSSFKLRGSCAGSRSFIEYGLKFSNLTEQTGNFREYSQDRAIPFTTWHSPYIDYSKDWVLLHDCTRWDRLEVAVGFSGLVDRGTEDSIYISFARDTNKAPSYLIQDRPYHGQWYKVPLDLQWLFDTKTIHMDDISYFRLFAKKVWGAVDRWRVTTRCAEDPSLWLVNEQYRGIEKTVDALWAPPDNEISGDIDISGWKWANPSASLNVTLRLHDGSEF